MPAVVTVGATLSCPHPPGVVTLVGAPTLKGGGVLVLTKTTLMGAAITGCSWLHSVSGLPAPCLLVDLITGESSKVTAGAIGVILANTTVKCSNTEYGPSAFPITIVETQTALTASG